MPFPESSYARSGRFSEIYPVGRGAAGQVYSAVDNLGRRVAVKEALPRLEGFAIIRAKFEKESRLQAALDHPNIVRVHHLEEDPETNELYLISEFADRGSLAELLEAEGPLPEAQAISIAIDICNALEEIERRRIVHRDVKPSNILLFSTAASELTAKLGDFGIAQDARQRKTTMLPGTSHPGTPLYMAPEQADVTAVLDSRADIFALGVTLWELLTREDFKALLRDGAGPTLQQYNPGASAMIGQVIARATRPDRAERYQTPREFADDLQHILRGEGLAPQTIRLAPRSAALTRGGLFGWLRTLGPLAATLLLMFWSTLCTAALVGVSRFRADAQTSGSVAVLAATSDPAFFSDDSGVSGPSPVPGFAPTAPPAWLGTQVGTAVAATTTAAALPTPWAAGTAMAQPDGCRAGSGRVASEQRGTARVTAVELEGLGRLELRQGSSESLTITADDNILPMIYSYVEGNRLVLGMHGCVRSVTELRYILTVRDLEAVTVGGSGSAALEQISAERLNLRISGTGSIEADGTVDQLSVLIDGAGDVRGQGLASRFAEVEISGTGSVETSTSDRLAVTISGAGSVRYFGDPAVVQTISGVGNVQQQSGP
jgi:hypothetical protein